MSPFARSPLCPIVTAARLSEGISQTRNRFLGSQLLVLPLVLISLCWRRELGLLERRGDLRRCPGQASSFLRLQVQVEVHSRHPTPEHHRLEQQRLLRDHHGLGHLCHGPCRVGHHGLLGPYPLCCAMSVPLAAALVLRGRMVEWEWT